MRSYPVTLLLVSVTGLLAGFAYQAFFKEVPLQSESVVEEATTEAPFIATERYSGRVDRVDVVLEHQDYTRYRLTTNGLMREGRLNTQRGFEDDADATVYVLNWQKPEDEQMQYVRLTAEPGRLYLLDRQRKIVRGSVLNVAQ